jgi:hypothetical protein
MVTLLDDVDDVPRPAQVLAERDGRVLVRITRDVGMTYVHWQDACRVTIPGRGGPLGRAHRDQGPHPWRNG